MSVLADPATRQELVQRLATAPELFCFLDYDGTLAPIAPRPELALPAPGAKAVVEDLAALPGGHVAVVSGRRAHDVRQLLAAAGIYYVGLHGAELLTPAGEHVFSLDPETIRPWIQRVREWLVPVVSELEGVWLEDKEVALACHTRLASPGARARAERAVREVYDRVHALGAPLRLLHGHCVWELRPAGVDKGSAVLKLWQDRCPGCLPFYAGDDATDEDAFRALSGCGVTVRVGPASVTAAAYAVATPMELIELLQSVCLARRGRSS